MSRDDGVVLDIVLACRRIADFVAGHDRKKFEADRVVQSAVLYQIVVIGEAARRLSQAYRDAHPDMPWALAAGMRNRLVHEYDKVNLSTVWRTVTDDVPTLLRHIEGLVPRRDPDK